MGRMESDVGGNTLAGLLRRVMDLVKSGAVAKPEFYNAERLKADFGAGTAKVFSYDNFTKTLMADVQEFPVDSNLRPADAAALAGAAVRFHLDLTKQGDSLKGMAEGEASARLDLGYKDHSIKRKQVECVVGQPLRSSRIFFTPRNGDTVPSVAAYDLEQVVGVNRFYCAADFRRDGGNLIVAIFGWRLDHG